MCTICCALSVKLRSCELSAVPDYCTVLSMTCQKKPEKNPVQEAGKNGTERRRKSGTGQRPEDASPGLAGGLKAFVLNLGRHISQAVGETERSV